MTFTAYYTFDFLKDKASWIWRIGGCPYWPCKVFQKLKKFYLFLSFKVSIAAFSSYLACVFTYPWAVVSREMVDFWPSEKGAKNNWNSNYRAAGSPISLILFLFFIFIIFQLSGSGVRIIIYYYIIIIIYCQTTNSPPTSSPDSSKTTSGRNSLCNLLFE